MVGSALSMFMNQGAEVKGLLEVTVIELGQLSSLLYSSSP